MKKIIVTGCNGQLGRAVNKLYAGDNTFEFVNTDVGELDITSIDRVMELAREIKPYAIINCAAHTAVDACETEGDRAYKITDYVFDGKGTRPYTEFDPTGPQGMYGLTKLAGENFVKDFADRYFIIRTAWLYGDGKNFVKTMLKLSETHEKVRVVKDQVGSPTSADELAKAIAYLLPTENYGLFHGTCEGDCSWSEFADEIFRLAGKKTVVEAITTEEYGAAAARPAYSILDNYMFRLTSDFVFSDWHDAVARYMKGIG